MTSHLGYTDTIDSSCKRRLNQPIAPIKLGHLIAFGKQRPLQQLALGESPNIPTDTKGSQDNPTQDEHEFKKEPQDHGSCGQFTFQCEVRYNCHRRPILPGFPFTRGAFFLTTLPPELSPLSSGVPYSMLACGPASLVRLTARM